MTGTRIAVLAIVFAFSWTMAVWPDDLAAAEFSAEAAALPYPPDARELEFVAWAGDIKYESPSSLKPLAAFYLKEMAARGWTHDESAVEIDDDSIELTFKHGDAEIELNLSQWSEAVHVRMDCNGLKFTGTDDPAKLAAAGVPVSRAALFLQKEIPLPTGAQDVQYGGDGCNLKSSMKLQEVFDYFTGLIKGKGFRESRRPIVTDTRRYTEFKKGSAEMSVNVFTHEVGSRIVLEYEDQARQTPIPPLPAVASLPIKNPGSTDETMADEAAAAPKARTPIDIVSNKGSATVNYGSKKYVFPHIACYQDSGQSSDATAVVFSAKPIPVNKMQEMVAKSDHFSFSDLYEFEFPEHFILQIGKYPSLTFSVSGVGIGGHSTENAVGDMRAEGGRVRGTLKMAPEEILSRQLSFTATADAAIITPNTRIAGPGDPIEQSELPVLADSPVPMPEGAEDVSREGSNFRKTYRGEVAMPLDDVASFYRKELTAKGWKRVDAQADGDPMQFKNDTTELSVALKRQGSSTVIEIVARDFAAARREGLLPEPGMGRLVMANGHNVGVTYTIGETDYRLKAGQGAENPKQALNYSVPPGTYPVIVKIPGQRPQTETIEMTEGATWGIITLPTGGYLPMRMY